jgi:hypothetical protein
MDDPVVDGIILFWKIVALLWLIGNLSFRIYDRRQLKRCGIPFSKEPRK